MATDMAPVPTPSAVITGAGSGIGRAVAVRMSREGYRVALLGRRVEALSETRALCGERAEVLVQRCDVTRETDVDTAFAEILRWAGRIDLLFNNAGNFPSPAPFGDIDYAAWRAIVETNLNGAFLCARAAFRAMRDQSPGGGRIINNGSVSAQVPRPQAAAYTASKHAMTGLTKAILLDGRLSGIVASQIDIGNAGTDLSAGVSNGALQADGTRRDEPLIPVDNVADTIALIAAMPLEANIPFVTVMATGMPLFGRG